MEKLPTAEEILQKHVPNRYTKENSWKNAMIEFAKLHVEACKKDIADDYTYYLEGDEGSERLDSKRFFKEAYPLTNIK